MLFMWGFLQNKITERERERERGRERERKRERERREREVIFQLLPSSAFHGEEFWGKFMERGT